MEHVAFDLGQVVFNVDFSNVYRLLMSYYGISETLVNEFINDCDCLHNMGIMTLSQVLRSKFPGHFGDTYWSESARVIDVWNTCIHPNETMLYFIEELLYSRVKIALLSNIGAEHAGLLRTKWPILNKCIQHFSFEVGASKPQKLYFQSFLLDNDDFSGCVFLDDRIENIKAAKKHKFNAIHFNLKNYNEYELKKELTNIKNKINCQ